MRILGIDPGSRMMGYGIIGGKDSHNRYVASGCVRVWGEALPDRLKVIFQGVAEIVTQYRPDEVAIERVFVHHNADSALKLGQARGAAICASVMQDLPVHEYTPREIKQAIVGTGGAAKSQVQHMVKVLLAASGELQGDAADALAVALCHSHMRQTLTRMPELARIYHRRSR